MCSISNGTLDTPLAHERRLFSRMFSGILAALARASVRFPPAGLATRPWPWAPWSPSGPRGPTGPMGPMPTWDPRRNTTSRKCAAEPSVKETSQYIYIYMQLVCWSLFHWERFYKTRSTELANNFARLHIHLGNQRCSAVGPTVPDADQKSALPESEGQAKATTHTSIVCLYTGLTKSMKIHVTWILRRFRWTRSTE